MARANRMIWVCLVIAVWTLPLTGALDPLLALLPAQAQTMVILMYCVTFALLIPLGSAGTPKTFFSSIIIVLCLLAAFIYAARPAFDTVSYTGLQRNETIDHPYIISLYGIYAVNGLYLLILRLLLSIKA